MSPLPQGKAVMIAASAPKACFQIFGISVLPYGSFQVSNRRILMERKSPQKSEENRSTFGLGILPRPEGSEGTVELWDWGGGWGVPRWAQSGLCSA